MTWKKGISKVASTVVNGVFAQCIQTEHSTSWVIPKTRYEGPLQPGSLCERERITPSERILDTSK